MAAKTASATKTKPTDAKPSAKKVAVKPAAKPVVKQTVNKKGMKYSCSVCGMVVAVDTVCGCPGVCDLICCSAPMKVKK